MAGVIDSLLIVLGFDTSGLTQGQKDVDAVTQRMKDSATRSGKAIEESADRASKSVEALGRKFLGLYALVTGGEELKSFVSNMTSADAALGRTARNVDMSAKALSTWQSAAVAAGGSAEGITGTISSLSSAMQEAALTGNNRLAPVMRALGVNLADAGGHARNVGVILTDLNRRYNSMHIDPARFASMMHMIGVDDGTINLLERSTTEFDKLIAEQQKYAATSADADAAQRRQSGWRELLLTSQSLGRSILTALTPAITGAMKAVQQWADANQGWIRTAIVEKIGQFVDYLRGLDWKSIGDGVATFVGNVRDIAAAVADAVKGIDPDSPLAKGLEALAILAGVRLVGAFTGLTAAIGGLGSVSLPGWFTKLIGLTGAAALGASAESTPDAETQKRQADFYKQNPDAPKTVFGAIGNWWKSHAATWAGGDSPEAKDRAADIDRQRDAQRAAEGKASPTGSFWGDLKRMVGFGDDPKVKDGIADTAKATGEIRDLLKRQADGLAGSAFGGVTESSGGLGGSGRHADGSGPGASLRDRQFHGKGNFGQKGWWTPERQSYAVDYLMKNAGLTEDGAKALVARWRFVESPGGPTAVNPKSGAAGIAQGLGSRRAGYTGSFDDQLKNAARELNGSEGRAKRMLNTPGMEATGASQFERAEGYDPRTGRDNFTGRVAEGMKHIAHGVTSPASGAPAVGDQAALDAYQRITAGRARPGDQALIERHRQEQNAPAPAAASGPTIDHAVRAALHAMAHANHLLHHGDRPVQVEDKSALKLQERTFGKFVGWGQRHPDQLDHARAMAHGRAASLAAMTRMADAGRYSVTHRANSSHTEHHMHGDINVQTRATDAKGIAGDLGPYLFQGSDARQANRGLA